MITNRNQDISLCRQVKTGFLTNTEALSWWQKHHLTQRIL